MRLRPHPHTHVAVPAGVATRPALSTQAGEWRVALEVGRLVWSTPRLAAAPRGDGRIVVCSPGIGAPESTMAPLRAYLRLLGHDSRHWGEGRNSGDLRVHVPSLVARVEAMVRESGREVDLVGWSLGGVASREVARERPDLVRRVVTLGSPVVGGPLHTVFADRYEDGLGARLAASSAAREVERPLQVPVTAVWTRRDGVVHWRACVDESSPDVTNVEVGSTHLGLGIDPDVWLLVARTLAP